MDRMILFVIIATACVVDSFLRDERRDFIYGEE